MSFSLSVPFVKASACGNDFLIIDGIHAPVNLAEFSRQICDRHQGVGADGVEWLFPASDADDHWWIPSGQSLFSTNPADNAATESAQRVIDHARERGVLLLKCGPHKNVVRLLPPLTASPGEITSGVSMLDAAVHDARA